MAPAGRSGGGGTARTASKKSEVTPPSSLSREIAAPAAIQGQLLDGPKVPGSFFPIALIAFVLKMVIEGAISMRAASRISGLICELCGGHRFDGLTHATVQNYLLRVGLDQIENADESPNRFWIMDHLIAAGSLKCFVVLGIDADHFATLQRPLQHNDVKVLLLLPTEVSNGSVVNHQLTELAQRRGVPQAILSDSGSDLKKGVELFQQEHPQTIASSDIVHLASRLIWKRMGKDDRFGQYRQACRQCANQVRQHALAHLKPPRPKTKARYMNLDPEVRWGRRALWLLDRVRSGDLTKRQQNRLKLEDVEAKLGWLEEHREDLQVWTELCAVGQSSCNVVRRYGYSPETHSKLKASLGPGAAPAAQQMITEITTLVKEQCDRLDGHAIRLPGSSEVIESLIGKGKRLLGTSQNNNTITGQILSIAASTASFTVEHLSGALRRCRISHLKTWLKKHIKPGTHVARTEDLTEPNAGTKLAQTKIAATPNF